MKFSFIRLSPEQLTARIPLCHGVDGRSKHHVPVLDLITER